MEIMIDLLLAEELFLLVHDEASGKGDATVAIDNGYAGALLLELASDGLVVLKDKVLRAAPGPASHPLLAEAHDRLTESEKLHKPDYWVTRLPAALKPLDAKLGQSLVHRGVLSEKRGKRLGLFRTTAWPEVDPAPERELRARLSGVVTQGVEPDAHLGLLICLLSALNGINALVEKPDRRVARKRAQQIAEQTTDGAAVSAAVAKSVQAVQAAVLVAVMIPVMTTVTT